MKFFTNLEIPGIAARRGGREGGGGSALEPSPVAVSVRACRSQVELLKGAASQRRRRSVLQGCVAVSCDKTRVGQPCQDGVLERSRVDTTAAAPASLLFR